MADTITLDPSLFNFLGALLGGAISGGIGILLMRYKSMQDSRRELIETAYRPWLRAMRSRDLEVIKSGDSKAPIWQYPNDFDHYVISRLDKKIKKLSEKNFEIGNDYNLAVMQFTQDYLQNGEEIVSIFRDAFEKTGLLEDSDIIRYWSNTVKDWVGFFKYPLLVKEIKDENDLYEKLLEHVKFHGDKVHYPVWLKRIKIEKPEFFSTLFSKIQLAREKIIIKIDDNELSKKRDVLFQKYEELKQAVMKKCE